MNPAHERPATNLVQSDSLHNSAPGTPRVESLRTSIREDATCGHLGIYRGVLQSATPPLNPRPWLHQVWEQITLTGKRGWASKGLKSCEASQTRWATQVGAIRLLRRGNKKTTGFCVVSAAGVPRYSGQPVRPGQDHVCIGTALRRFLSGIHSGRRAEYDDRHGTTPVGAVRHLISYAEKTDPNGPSQAWMNWCIGEGPVP